MTENALTGPGRWGVYTDSRPKDKVSDPGFARALGMLEAVVMQLDRELPEDAGIALGWAVLELSDFSELEAAEVVGYDLSGRDAREVLEEARAGVAQLAQESVELGTTLRYLRAEEHLREAVAATVAAGVAAAVAAAVAADVAGAAVVPGQE